MRAFKVTIRLEFWRKIVSESGAVFTNKMAQLNLDFVTFRAQYLGLGKVAIFKRSIFWVYISDFFRSFANLQKVDKYIADFKNIEFEKVELKNVEFLGN